MSTVNTVISEAYDRAYEVAYSNRGNGKGRSTVRIESTTYVIEIEISGTVVDSVLTSADGRTLFADDEVVNGLSVEESAIAAAFCAIAE